MLNVNLMLCFCLSCMYNLHKTRTMCVMTSQLFIAIATRHICILKIYYIYSPSSIPIAFNQCQQRRQSCNTLGIISTHSWNLPYCPHLCSSFLSPGPVQEMACLGQERACLDHQRACPDRGKVRRRQGASSVVAAVVCFHGEGGQNVAPLGVAGAWVRLWGAQRA